MYHSTSYRRATKANNYTVGYHGGLGVIENFIHVASGVVAFVQNLETSPTGLSVGHAEARTYLKSRIVVVQRGSLKAIRVEDITEKCVWCPVGPAKYVQE
jgi:hypothetical protein